jgi:hypothetical protein
MGYVFINDPNNNSSVKMTEHELRKAREITDQDENDVSAFDLLDEFPPFI